MTVRLRARTADDVDLLFEVFSELDTWEERNPSPPRPVVRADFERRLAAGDFDGDVHFVVEADGRAVGRCTLMHEDPLTRSAEIGIALSSSARGRGVGTAALDQLVEFAFVRRNLRRLQLSVLATNAAAIKVYRKLGFVEEGRRREACWVRGGYEDEVLMALLRSEWTGPAAARGQ
jgi:RimJ/RimL family protein N-acetyltransferase